jgi:hypothetical protein
MKNRLLICFFGLFVSRCAAFAKTGELHQSATVLRVQKHEADAPLVGGNPTDAPLHSSAYLYDVSLRVDCKIYVVRYESAFDQPPPLFTPERQVDGRVEKHVLYASMPGGGGVKLTIIKRGADSAAPCSPR